MDAEGEESLGGIGALLTAREKANAKKFAKMIIVDPFSSAKEEFGHHPIVNPSLQYLPILFPALSAFNGWVAPLAGHALQGPWEDAEFVDQVFSKEYIPYMENYVNQEIAYAFNNLDCMVADAIMESGESRVQGKLANHIPRAFVSFVGLFELLVSLARMIPDYQTRFEQILLALCTTFQERVNGIFRNLTCRTAEESAGSKYMTASAAFAANKDLRDLLREHSLFSPDADPSMDAALAEKEALTMERLKSDRSFVRDEIIMDYRIVHEIALLHRGLELLPRILLARYGCTRGLHASRPSIEGNEAGLYVATFGGVVETAMAFSETFSAAFGAFLTSSAQLALTCLLTLRLEIRTHAFYYVDLALRESNYLLDDPVNEPDAYISLLFRDLTSLDLVLEDWFPEEVHGFLMEGLSQTLEYMLINGYRYLKGCNAHGYAKLQENVKALEQLLYLVCSPAEGSLSAVVAYYQLASKGIVGLLENAKACEHKFTLMQYQAILDAHYRFTAEGEGPAEEEDLRQEYQNQLVRLKYLSRA